MYKLTSPAWIEKKKKYIDDSDYYNSIEELITAIFNARNSMRQGYDVTLVGNLDDGYIMSAVPKPNSKLGKKMSEDA